MIPKTKPTPNDMLLLRIIKNNNVAESGSYPLIFTASFFYSNRTLVFSWAHGIQKKDFISRLPCS